mmetsp:Transcript_16020/g.33879  ORF Transcript_16020/g.33879 Transcript_16020/m.33879 type:complete len:361 (-) Transcript_16020:35-1117(-)
MRRSCLPLCILTISHVVILFVSTKYTVDAFSLIRRDIIHNGNGAIQSKSFQPNTNISITSSRRQSQIIEQRTKLFSSSTPDDEINDTIEPYIGPIGSLADMEGGVAIGNLALHVLAGPSLVAPGLGLFLSIYDDFDGDDGGAVEEIIIPRGTPLCGYARGYFSDEQDGDKSVGFLFGENSADGTAVFYEKQLMTLGDALWSVYEDQQSQKRQQQEEEEGAEEEEEGRGLLFGHKVEMNADTREMIITPDEEFLSRIFIPDTDDESSKFAATSLGIYANDLAYDPDSTKQQYFANSEQNNVLQLAWRLAKDETSDMLVPTWPVVMTRKDVRLLNSVPMEVGLQYGFNYWDAVVKEGVSKYI